MFGKWLYFYFSNKFSIGIGIDLNKIVYPYCIELEQVEDDNDETTASILWISLACFHICFIKESEEDDI